MARMLRARRPPAGRLPVEEKTVLPGARHVADEAGSHPGRTMTTNDDTIRALAIEAVAAMQRRDLPDPEWRARVSEALDRLIEAAGSGEGNDAGA